jgi:hypothetical protein
VRNEEGKRKGKYLTPACTLLVFVDMPEAPIPLQTRSNWKLAVLLEMSLAVQFGVPHGSEVDNLGGFEYEYLRYLSL